jgi:hypothetical protein
MRCLCFSVYGYIKQVLRRLGLRYSAIENLICINILTVPIHYQDKIWFYGPAKNKKA